MKKGSSCADGFDRELAYRVLIHLAREMVRKGLMSEEEYREAEMAMRKKYDPPSGGLFSGPA